MSWCRKSKQILRALFSSFSRTDHFIHAACSPIVVQPALATLTGPAAYIRVRITLWSRLRPADERIHQWFRLWASPRLSRIYHCTSDCCHMIGARSSHLSTRPSYMHNSLRISSGCTRCPCPASSPMTCATRVHT
jgi:hypothetical protein